MFSLISVIMFICLFVTRLVIRSFFIVSALFVSNSLLIRLFIVGLFVLGGFMFLTVIVGL